MNRSDPNGDIAWWAAAALGGAVWEVASYFIGNAISGQKSTIKGAAKAAVKGAVVGLAFGAAGKVASKAIGAVKAAKYTSGTANKVGKIGEQLSGITKKHNKV